MKRLGAILLLLALFVTGCVQEYPYELEDAFSEQASSPSPSIVQDTPAIFHTPKAAPAASAAPKATPVLPSPSPEETARLTPAPSPLPDEKEQTWPAAEERLYLDEEPGAASPVYRFEGGSYTEQDMRMLAILLRMQQWRSLNSLVQAFQSAITPDIRLCDFIQEDAITPSVTVNGPVMMEAHSLAYIEMRYADQTAYLLLFKELEEGVFHPLSLVKIDDVGGLAMPYALQEAGGTLFLIADIREQYSPPYSYSSYDRLMENWYDLADGQKKLSIALTCSMEQNVQGVYRRVQLYEAQFDREKASKAGQGIYLEFNQRLQFHVAMEGGQSFVLQNAAPCRLYFDMQERRFFTDTPEGLFYARSGYMEEWQYKHVFQEEFTSMQTQMADPFLQEFANAVFGVGDPAKEAPYIPEEEQREYLQQESARIMRVSPHDTGAQTERTLIALQNDINGMRYQGLADTLLRYSHRAESYYGEEGQPFDVLWSKAEDVRCFLDFTTAKERQAYLELRYRQKGEYKGILIVFEPVADTWVQSGAYQYTYAGSRGDLPAIAYAQGDLFITIPAGRKNGQMGWETLVVRNGKPLLYYVSDYRDGSGITYKTDFRAQGDEQGALHVAAYLDGVEQAIFKWQVKLWVKDGGVFAEQGISKLAYGNADDHPELRGALLTTLKALAEDEAFTARSEARRCLRKLR